MTTMRALIAATSLTVVTACGGSADIKSETSSTPQPTTRPALSAKVAVVYTNVMAISGEVLGEDQGSCETTGGKFEAIRDGAQVTILDSGGDIVATSALEAFTEMNNKGKLCAWTAEFDDIPAGGKFYTAKVGELSSDVVAEANVSTGFKIEP